MIADLIYDVGMNNGDDTAYYLFKGFRVVAVEADPTLIETGSASASPTKSARPSGARQCRHRSEGGDRIVLDLRGRSEWNSFDRQVASRDGLPHHAIDVQCRPFRSLLEQFGVPSYLKIDIEGHDHYCVADLDPRDLPRYISLEMGDR